MSIRGLILALFFLSALGLAWQQREQLRAWLGSVSVPSVPMSISDQPAPAAMPSTSAAPGTSAAKFRAGELRKCVNGQQVAYTNVECPPGFKAQAVAAAAVTVVPGTPVAKPDAAASGPSALHKALDISRDDTLHDKMIQRAIDGPR